jgi:hypothetical protein
MWKLLRNLVLAAVLVAGALKLLAGYSVGKDAQRVVAALAPYAQIKYDSIAAGLDGSVTLTGLSVTPKVSPRVYRASKVVLHSPGLFWILGHALRHQNTLPEHLVVDIEGLALPSQPWLNSHWWDSRRYVLFASAGCPNEPSSLDFQRMSGNADPPRDRFEYTFDPSQRSLDASLKLAAPGMATIDVALHASRFEPATMGTAAFWKKFDLDRFSTDYTDHGFFANRNRYCADRARLTVPQFIDRHVGTVQAWLAKAGVQPSDEVLAMYRSLVTSGGSAKLLSLPSAQFGFESWRGDSRDELLRHLNVTARYREQAPIMFRLAFAPTLQDQATLLTDSVPETSQVNAGTTAQASAEPHVVAPPTPAVTPPPAHAPAAPATTPTPVVVAAPAPKLEQPHVLEPIRAKLPIPTLDYLDRAVAKVPPPPIKAMPEPPSLTDSTTTTVASAPPPAPGSTLALVWKPGVIEELPEAAPVKKDYVIVEFARLPQLTNRHVRVLTQAGKRIEGFVVSADTHEVVLRVERGSGNAQFTLARERIEQVQLLHY